MKKRGTILAVLLTAIVLAGCGSSGKSEAAAESAAYDAGSYKRSNDFVTADTSAEWDGDYEEAVAEEAPVSGSAETVTEADVKDQGSKIIRNANISMDVDDLNVFSENLKRTVNSYKGYIESADVNDYDSDYSENRYGYFTVRIPAERLDDFLSIVEGEGNITSKGESAEDVTMEYVDIEAHIATYEAERDSLMQLMDRAESIEDILKIREQLRDINYELDSLKRQLKSMQNKVSYSTVSIEAKETRSIMGSSKKKSFAARIAEKFVEEFADGWEIALDVLIFIVTRIPLFAILGGVVFVIVKIVKKIRSKGNKQAGTRTTQVPQTHRVAQTSQMPQTPQTPQAEQASEAPQTPQAVQASEMPQTSGKPEGQ